MNLIKEQIGPDVPRWKQEVLEVPERIFLEPRAARSPAVNRGSSGLFNVRERFLTLSSHPSVPLRTSARLKLFFQDSAVLFSGPDSVLIWYPIRSSWFSYPADGI